MPIEAASLLVNLGIDGVEKVTGGLNQADQAVQGFGLSASKILGGVVVAGAAAAVAGLGALGIAGARAAGDLQQSVANISTIKPEIDTTAVFASLNEMQTRVPQTADALGDSLYNIFSSISVSQADALKLTEEFARSAVGAGTSAETFGTAALGVMNAYGLAASDASHISDVFFNTVNAGVVSGEELAGSLGPVTQSAKAAGVSLDELGALIAGVTKEGGPASQNINNLNNFLQKISTASAQKQLKGLGIATVDATGAFRPTLDVLTDLKGRLGDMTEAERANALQAIFPDAQARIGAQTILSQLDFVKQALDTNINSSGSAAAAYEKMSGTFNSQMTLAKNSVMALATTIGGAVLPAITGLLQTAIIPAINGATEFAQAFFQSGDKLGFLTTAINGVIPGFQTLVNWLQVAIPAAIATAMTVWSGTLYPALQAVGGFIMATVIPAFMTLGAWLSSVLPRVISIAVTAFDLIRDGLQTFIDAYNGDWANSDKILLIHQAFGVLGNFIGQTLVPAFQTFAGWLQTNIPVAVATLSGLWNTTLLPAFQATAAFIGETVIPAIQGLVGWLQQNWDMVTQVGAAIGIAVGVFATLSAVVSTVTGIIATVTGAFAAASGAIAASGGIISTVVAILGGPLTIAIGAVALAAGALYLAWQTNFGGIQEKTAAVIGWLQETAWPWLANAFNTVATVVLPVLQTAFATAWSGISTAVRVAYTFLRDTVWPWLQNTAFPWLQNTALPALKVAFETAWNGISTAVGTVYTFLSGTVWPWMQNTAFPWLTNTALPALKGAWSDTFGQFKPIIDQFWPYLRDNVWPTLKSIWDNTINNELPALKAAWNDVFGAFKPIIDEFWPYLRDDVWPTLQSIWANTINNELPALQSAWDSTFGELQRAISTAKDQIVTAWNTVSTTAETTKTLVITAWETLRSTVVTKIGEVVAEVQAIPGKVTAAIGDLGSLLFSAGASIIQGLIDGINSALDDLLRLLASISNMIPDWKGPAERDAKLLYENGQLIMKGLIGGIQSQETALQRTLAGITAGIGGDASWNIRSNVTSGYSTMAPPVSPRMMSIPSVTSAGQGGDTYITNYNVTGNYKNQSVRTIGNELRLLSMVTPSLSPST